MSDQILFDKLLYIDRLKRASAINRNPASCSSFEDALAFVFTDHFATSDLSGQSEKDHRSPPPQAKNIVPCDPYGN